MAAMRIAAIRNLSVGIVFLGALGAAGLPAAAQSAAQALGSSLSDPLSQEVLRALQQRGGAQTIDPGVQPNVEIQNPAVYPQNAPTAPAAARQNPAALANGLSGLERLMSLRTGQRLQQFGYDIFGRGNPVVMRQSGALQDNYILGDGDEIVVSLHGQENANYRSR